MTINLYDQQSPLQLSSKDCGDFITLFKDHGQNKKIQEELRRLKISVPTLKTLSIRDIKEIFKNKEKNLIQLNQDMRTCQAQSEIQKKGKEIDTIIKQINKQKPNIWRPSSVIKRDSMGRIV
jgi:hypothetical protein